MGVLSVFQKLIDILFQNLSFDLPQGSDFSQLFDQVLKELQKEIENSDGNLLEILKAKFNIQDPNFEEKLKEIIEKLKEDKRDDQTQQQLQSELVSLFYVVSNQSERMISENTENLNQVKTESQRNFVESQRNFVQNIYGVEFVQSEESENLVSVQENADYEIFEGEKSKPDQKEQKNDVTNGDESVLKQVLNSKDFPDSHQNKEVVSSKDIMNSSKKDLAYSDDTSDKKAIDEDIPGIRRAQEQSFQSEVEKLKRQEGGEKESSKFNDNDKEFSRSLKFYSAQKTKQDGEVNFESEDKIYSSDEKRQGKGDFSANFESVKYSENAKDTNKVQSDTQNERIQRIKEIISDSLKISINSHQRRAVVDTNLGGVRLSLEVQVDLSNKVYISIATPDEGLRQELSNSYDDFRRFMQENNFLLAKFDLNNQSEGGKNNLENMVNFLVGKFDIVNEANNRESFSYGTIFSNIKGRINFVA